MMSHQGNPQAAIEITNLSTVFGKNVVHQDLNLQIERGEILGLVGGSGSGKTTLVREILMLTRPAAGSIHVFGQDILSASSKQQLQLRQHWGMMFQHGALFSSMTVLENVCFPLREFTKLSLAMVQEIALYKLSLAKFPLDLVHLYPAELSGGMIKRVALARAIVQDAEILFLDEPTAGLDPTSAAGLDELVLHLKKLLGLTIVVITHDVDTLWRVTDRVAFLGEKRVLAIDTMQNLHTNPHPLLQAYFSGPRGRAATPKGEDS